MQGKKLLQLSFMGLLDKRFHHSPPMPARVRGSFSILLSTEEMSTRSLNILQVIWPAQWEDPGLVE